MTPSSKKHCPDCQHDLGNVPNDAPHEAPSHGKNGALSRREFVQQTGTLAWAAGALSMGALSMGSWLPGAFAAPTRSSQAETDVQHLYELLSPKQREEICFPFDHPSRTRISANWRITDHIIDSDFYTKEQQEVIARIFKGLTSEEGHERFLKQMDDDDGGFGVYQIAIFGEPKSGQFEWELTGRHMTIRADGDSVQGAAFGGPVVYGHGDETIQDNLFYYQTQQANEVFRALDEQQVKQALLAKAPDESAVQLQGDSGQFPGLAVSELSSDQQAQVESVIKTLLAPYREDDVTEAMEIIKQGGGLDTLHFAFFREGDLNDDQEWDIWRIEGPTFVSHFRGAPHVHAYLNIGRKA